MRFTLRQLEVFLAVARSESVSRAAEELGMSQSAVSGALAELERQFDIRLFDRVGKRLRLSALGRSLRARADSLHEQARELERAFASQSDAGLLRVGATLTIGDHLAVPLIARFMGAYPGARVKLDIGNTAEIARRVLNFEIDVGLIEGEINDPELSLRRWRDDELVVFCATGHALARKAALDDDDLRSVPWILREPGSGTRQAFEHAMHGLLPELRIALELQHTEAIKSAVEAGLGFGCLSRIAVADAVERGLLASCRVPQRDLRRQLFFVLHREKYQGSMLARFLEVCEQHAA